MTPHVTSSEGWIRSPYSVIDLSAPGVSLIKKVPAAPIRARVSGTPPSPAREDSSARSIGALDTGATKTVAPLWASYKAGVAVGEHSKIRMPSASGWTRAYRAEID